MNARGFTLLESVIALGILSVTLMAMLPAMQTFMDANTLSEERSDALAAAQEVMEALRHRDPASLPSSGSAAVQAVQVGAHEYEVVTHYCQNGSYCGTDTRHITVEVSFAGKSVYTIETVFTRLH
jgi:prepilin-type N-terminal cleavage/methylation domain-containing protein